MPMPSQHPTRFPIDDIQLQNRFPLTLLGRAVEQELVHEALRLLREQAPVQARVILAAAELGGRVDRATVYKLGNYAPERMLRGFTRPVTRIARMLQERGVLAADVPDLLVPRYDRGVQASSFDIPASVVPWVLSIRTRPRPRPPKSGAV